MYWCINPLIQTSIHFYSRGIHFQAFLTNIELFIINLSTFQCKTYHKPC